MNTYIRFVQAALLVMLCSGARAEVRNCSEITPPVLISQPGVYCLKKDHVVTSTGGLSGAIVINSGNVTLDMNGFRVVRGQQGPNVGIQVRGGNNITIRNGALRGFLNAVLMEENGWRARVVEDMFIDTDRGSELGFGIYVENVHDVVIRRNRFTGKGGFAVLTEGNRVSVLNNEIYGQSIDLSGDGSMVMGNRISDEGIEYAETSEKPRRRFRMAVRATGVVRDNMIIANPELLGTGDIIPAGEGNPGTVSGDGLRMSDGITVTKGVKAVNNTVRVNGTAYGGDVDVSANH
jgi:hypothetical protein